MDDVIDTTTFEDGDYWENAVCSIKYVAADLGKIKSDRTYYNFSCGPELLSEIQDKSYSLVEGSVFSCGYYTIDREKSVMYNQDYKGVRNVGFECALSRQFEETNLQKLKIGDTVSARIGFNVYTSTNADAPVFSGSSDTFEVNLGLDGAQSGIILSFAALLSTAFALYSF